MHAQRLWDPIDVTSILKLYRTDFPKTDVFLLQVLVETWQKLQLIDNIHLLTLVSLKYLE